MVIMDLRPSWDAMDAMGWQVFRKMVDLGWVAIWVRWGDNHGAFPWQSDG